MNMSIETHVGATTVGDLYGQLDVQQALASLAACPRLSALATKTFSNVDFTRRGARLVANGELVLGPFKAVPMSSAWAWESDPLNDRSWQWRLNWLSFISYLIAHHAESGEVSALKMAVDAAMSWLDHFKVRQSRLGFEFAWHDHGTALRAEQIALLLHYIETRGLWDAVAEDATVAATLARACIYHAELLAGESFFSRHTNHGLEQARVLLLISLAVRPAWPEDAGRWVDIATQRLIGELRHAFTDEGVHVENSPAYHVFVFKVVLGIVASFSDAGLEALVAWQCDIGPQALEFLFRVVRPDLTLPIIGDTEAIPVTDSFGPAFAGSTAYEQFQFVQSAGKRGKRPGSLHKVYPQSGYAIFRGDWATGPEFDKAFHMVFKAGAISRYHRQQDDGHLVVACDGEDWLIDSGMYNYDQKSPVRQYMRSRHGHNVWVLNRAVVEGREIPPRESWRILAFREDGPLPFVHAESLAYAGVRISRRISVFRRRCFRVDDVLSADDGLPFEAEVLWHLPADKEIEIRGPRTVSIRSKMSGLRLVVNVQGDLPAEIRVRRGVSRSRVVSVVSNKAGSSHDSQLLTLVFAPTKSIYSCLEFVFEEDEAQKPKRP